MPNGGELFYWVRVCPHCKSARIHLRKEFHLLARWRCRRCRKTFFAGKWQGRWVPNKGDPLKHWILGPDTLNPPGNKVTHLLGRTLTLVIIIGIIVILIGFLLSL